MELSEYREEFLNQLREDALLYENPDQIQFIEESLNLLAKQEEVVDPILYLCNIKCGNHYSGFHAYAYSEADSSIVLIITDFVDSTNPGNLTNEDIRRLHNKMQFFIKDSYDNKIKDVVDLSDDILNVAGEFRKKLGNAENTEITAFKFFIVTNKQLSSSVKSAEVPDLLGRPATLRLWTLERFFDNYRSSRSERIHITCKDWGIEGIQCIKANVSSSNIFDSYMGVMPGLFLAKLFKKYQSPLLEGNIRCFLSARGKINKSIKSTIIGDHPESFFTYNNGIAVIANSITLSNDQRYITEFDGFQIVNGGQTTASLTNALIRGEAPAGNLEKIFVPMKLTVLKFDMDGEEDFESFQQKKDLYNTIVHDIAKCSNWQNPTHEADFFSNDPFHIEMEKLSMLKENTAPVRPGEISGTYWFYERSKSRWNQATFYMKKAQRTAWIRLHPKNQVITKEKLGMYYNTVALLPYQVCKGGVNNMPTFAKSVMGIMQKRPETINSFFFKKYVAVKIIYDSTDKLIANADWYPSGGYKAMYIPYTISKIISSLPIGKEINWPLIWKRQSLYPSLAHQIEIVAKQTKEFFDEVSHGGNQRTYAIKEETWKKYLSMRLVLESDFIMDLINLEESKTEEKAQAKIARFKSEIDLTVKAVKLGYKYWLNLYNDLERQKILSGGERDKIKGIASYLAKNGILTDSQAKALWKIVKKIQDHTDYVLKEK